MRKDLMLDHKDEQDIKQLSVPLIFQFSSELTELCALKIPCY